MKTTFITDINKIKFEVNTEVARLAFAGELDEKANEIPYKLIPGRTPHYRCCVYREREIIRERVQLAMGRSAMSGQMNKNIVQVIEAACEGCPINRFNVTNNCQMCMAKKCLGACNFGAIKFEGGHAVIDHKKCKECGKCAEACPYNAIADLMRPCKRSCPVDAITMDEDNIVVINEEKCINCGQCVINCPFGALSDRSFMVDVIKLISSGAPEVEINLPAAEYIRREQFDQYYCTFDIYPEQTYLLKLISVTPKANANQLYTMRLQLLADKQPIPSPGMNTMVTIRCDSDSPRNLSVPGNAILQKNGKACVFVYNPSDNKVSSREVTVVRLMSDGRSIITSDGLKPGDLIVSAGIHYIENGEIVKPLPVASETNIGGLL